MPPKKTIVKPKITVNITINNNIRKYFNRAASPAPAPAAAVPVAEPVGQAPLFATNSEKYHKVHRTKDKKEIYVSAACNDGTLKAGCHGTCKNKYVDISRFAPDSESTQSAGKRQKFDKAYEAFKVAYAAVDKEEAIKQREIVEELRNDLCDSCRDRTLSPEEKACKKEWEKMKTEACEKNGGCQNQDCPERGMASWIVLQADHGKNEKKLALSDYKAWSSKKNGGVKGMREEAKRIEKWICGCCHSLEPTSDSGRRCPDPNTMSDGKRRGTNEEKKQYLAKRHAKISYPKYRYVDAKKREIGKCQYPGCNREVVAGNEQSFHFDHRKESTKCKAPDHPLFGNQGGVGGLAHKSSKAASLDKVRGLLDAEMEKCDLLCVNCHLSRKPKGLGRWQVA